MKIKDLLVGSLLLMMTSPIMSHAPRHSPYVDSEGFCVVEIHPSNPKKYIQQKVIDVPDISGHVVRLFHVEQTIKDTPLCHGDSLISMQMYGMTDYIDHDGSASGYVIYTSQQGHKLSLKFSANSQMKPGSPLADYQLVGRVIGGEGTFSAVKGDLQVITKFNRHDGVIVPVVNRLRYKIAQ